MRLRYIERVDFRKSEQTNFEALIKKDSYLAKGLSEEDVVLFINHGENQLVFVHGFKELQNGKRTVRVLSSKRLRIKGGTWNPLMLENYAEEIGMKLNLKRFEDFYKKLRDEE